MIRQVTSGLKEYYNENKYSGGFMCRVAYGPETFQYDTQIITQEIPSPAPSLNGSLSIRRRYRSKVPILKPANWRVLHELMDVYRIMQQLKSQYLYKKLILSLLNKITEPYQNHNQTPHLVLEYFPNPSVAKAIQQTPSIPIYPRSEHFNPLQIVVGTLVARNMIKPESNVFYQPHIKRAKLTPNALYEEHLKKSSISLLSNDKNSIRREEYTRHYKLDPEAWYKYWPYNRHNHIKHSVRRFIYCINEEDDLYLPIEHYQKIAHNTWQASYAFPNEKIQMENDRIEREKLADAIYHQFFQLTH